MHHLINSISVLLLVAGPPLITTLSQTPQDDATGERLAHLSYFQVESRAMLFGRESTNIDAEVRVLEQYSNEHGRARLEFKAQEFATNDRAMDDHHSSSRVKYIFSAKSNKLMRVSEVAPSGARFTCELSNRTALASDLFGPWMGTGDLRAPELADWERLVSNANMPGHVIGFARLLLFVELNRQNFVRVERSQGATVRNAEVEQFKFTFEVAGRAGREDAKKRAAPVAGKEATMIIYQGKDARASAGNPFRVWLQMPSRAELIVEFSSAGPVRPAAATGTSSLQGASGDLMGLFSFPLGRGCSQQLSAARADPRATESGKSPPPASGKRAAASQAVFSFEAQLSEWWFLARPAQLDHLFVAYDAHAQALRVDSHAGADTATTIHDFVLGRKYHLPTGGGGGGGDSRAPDGVPVMSSGGRQCLVARIGPKEREDLQDEETILPWSSLTEMGGALVRGIETQIYELVSEHLPRFLFQQVAYQDSAGAEQLAFNLKRRVSATTSRGDTQTNFSIVYFVTSTGGSGDNQLIRVDVYTRNVLLYRADVYNFQWHLADAPDGQLEEELFSLGDSAACLSPPWAETVPGAITGGILLRPPARMQLELDYLANGQMLHVLPADTIELLASPSARNKALIRGLAGYPSNSVFASQMRDLKTTINGLDGAKGANSSNLLRFVADVELAGLPRLEDVALRALSIGTALSSGSKKPSARSLTLEQCFWEAAGEFAATGGDRATSAVLFSFCSSKCWIDSRATVGSRRASGAGEQPLEYQSSVFMISFVDNRQLPCELLRIQRDTAIQLQPGDGELVRPWRDVQQNLHNKILSLVFVNEQQSSRGTAATLKQPELLFKVSKVTLTSTDREIDDPRQQVVDGLSLPAEAGLETFRMDALDQAPEACHAHCVAHLDCRSYSVCHDQQRADCVISALELDPSELRKQLANFYQLDRQSPERKSSLIAIVAPSGGATVKETKVTLEVNRRCQVRTVGAREMFRALRASEHCASGRTVWQTHLLPVANLSECARMCLRRNVNFFKRLTSLRSANSNGQDLVISSSEAGDGKPAGLRDQLSQAMRSWCHAFYFVDTKLEQVSYQLMGKLRKLWTAAGTLAATTGGADNLCYLARPGWAPADYTPRARIEKPNTIAAGKDQELVKLPFIEHEFRYSLLYERQPGFRLARTNANSDLEKAPSLIIFNNQSIESHPPDIEFCARQCFSQAAHWCRSFDVLTFAVASDRSGAPPLSCVYNSLSLRDAGGETSTQLLKQQMGVEQKSHTVGYDHYEPHEAYALDNAAASYLNSGRDAAPQQRPTGLDGHLSPPTTGGSNLIVCILAGLCTGSVAALLLMKLVYRKNHLPRHVRSHLDVPRLSREFICMEE